MMELRIMVMLYIAISLCSQSCRETLIQDPGGVYLNLSCRGRRSISAYSEMAVQEMQKRRLLVLNLMYPVKLAELSYKNNPRQ